MARQPSDAIRRGDAVVWDGVTCRVLKRRRVTGLAMFQTSDYEVKLVSLGGGDIGWVGENEVKKIPAEAN